MKKINKYIQFKRDISFLNKKYIKNVKYHIVNEDFNNYYLSTNDNGFSLCISKSQEDILYIVGYIYS